MVKNKKLISNVDVDKAISIPASVGGIKTALKYMFYGYRLENIEPNSELDNRVILFDTHKQSNRNDYDEIMNNFVGLSKKNMYCKIDFERKIFQDLGLFLRLYCKKFQSNEKSFVKRTLKKILFTRSIVFLTHFEQELDKLKYLKLGVTFSDGHIYDNLIAQSLKLRNIPTMTLQHGLYYRQNVEVPENYVIDNIVSDIILCWGDRTKNEVSRYNSHTKPIAVGSLRNYSFAIEQYKDYRIQDMKKHICILLNADNKLEANIRMIKAVDEFCSKNNYIFSIGYHPNSDRELYVQHLGKTFVGQKMLTEKYDFYIIYSSGVICELFCKANWFFIFDDENLPNVFSIESICFSNARELQDVISVMKSKNRSQFMNSIREEFIITKDIQQNYLNVIEEVLT